MRCPSVDANTQPLCQSKCNVWRPRLPDVPQPPATCWRTFFLVPAPGPVREHQLSPSNPSLVLMSCSLQKPSLVSSKLSNKPSSPKTHPEGPTSTWTPGRGRLLMLVSSPKTGSQHSNKLQQKSLPKPENRTGDRENEILIVFLKPPFSVPETSCPPPASGLWVQH